MENSIKMKLGRGFFGPLLHFTQIQTFFLVVRKRKETRGSLDTIKWIKSKRLNLFTFLAGKPIQQAFIATDKDGLGVAFVGLSKQIKSGDKDAIRLAKTILQAGRVLEGWNEPDLTTVTDPSKFDVKVMDGFNEFVKSRSPRFIRSVVTDWRSPHLTNKKGPKGPAI